MERNTDFEFFKILVTGANGQLGSEIKNLEKLHPRHTFTFTDIDTLDISNEKAVNEIIKESRPDIIVNCAAYTAVDKAEEEVDLAYKLNTEAPLVLAKAAHSIGSRMIHVSTDYVFNGNTWKPYVESDKTDPISVYGKSKLKGEEAVLRIGNTMVLRTSWLYSSYGNNFLKTILKKGMELPELRVVYDQIGCPTWAHDLAEAIIHITNSGRKQFKPEIFHYSNEGVCSWYDFAKEIAHQKELKCKISAILTSDYPTTAVRPPYSVMDKSKIKKTFGINIPHWRESLTGCIKNM